MSKINFSALDSARVTADNSLDTSKVYDIEATVHVGGSVVHSMDVGKVKKDGKNVASFSAWGENNFTINFTDVNEQSMRDILDEISVFRANVAAQSQTISIEL